MEKSLDERLRVYASKLNGAITKEKKALRSLDKLSGLGEPEREGLRDYQREGLRDYHTMRLQECRAVAETFYEHFPEYYRRPSN